MDMLWGDIPSTTDVYLASEASIQRLGVGGESAPVSSFVGFHHRYFNHVNERLKITLVSHLG